VLVLRGPLYILYLLYDHKDTALRIQQQQQQQILHRRNIVNSFASYQGVVFRYTNSLCWAARRDTTLRSVRRQCKPFHEIGNSSGQIQSTVQVQYWPTLSAPLDCNLSSDTAFWVSFFYGYVTRIALARDRNNTRTFLVLSYTALLPYPRQILRHYRLPVQSSPDLLRIGQASFPHRNYSCTLPRIVTVTTTTVVAEAHLCGSV
jgi:hypothetical protein